MVKVIHILVCVLLCLSALPSLARDEGMRKFQDIAARLDIGGDLFLVIHAGRWLDTVLSRLEGEVDGVPPATAAERDIRDVSGRVRRFAARHGMSGLQGVGVSSVPVQGGMSSLKVFLLRDAQDANLPFWRGLFGWQPRRLLSLDLLPSDTDFAWGMTPDVSGLWELLEAARGELELAQLDRMMQQITDISQWVFETEPLPLLESLRDEVLVAARAEQIPDAESAAAWEWLVVIGTGEPLLFQAIKAGFQRAGVSVEDVTIGGHTMHRVRADYVGTGVFSHVRAFAAVPGFVVIGNSHRMVEDALRSQRHRSGLLARPAFIDAFRGQNMVNNGIFYISQHGAETLRDMQDGRLRSSLGDGVDPFSQLLLETLAGDSVRGAVFALTLANWRQGIMISGRSGVGGAAMGSWLGSFPARWWLRAPEWLDDLVTTRFDD